MVYCSFVGKELHDRENKAIKEILSSCQVVLGTTTVISPDGPLKHLPADHFDLVVIDEAAQALEPACWIGLLRANKYVRKANCSVGIRILL